MAEYNNRRKKKVCMMCTGKQVNYKDPDSLKRYTNEKGKIVPRRITGNCARHQRYIAIAVGDKDANINKLTFNSSKSFVFI